MANQGIREELARLTLDLCAIPSETRKEERIANYVEERCRAVMAPGSVRRIGNSIICDPDRGRSGPAVALVGHLDTVKCAAEQPLEIRDERVYGCGASDMKGGVAVMLTLLERWKMLRGARPVWIFYDKEEGPNDENGLRPVMEGNHLPALDFAFILEPTDGTLQLGCVGVLHANVTVRGVRAHSARPWQGENALYRAIPLLERLRDFSRREVRFGDLSFYEVMVATQAETFNSKNVVPDALQLNLNYRFAPGKTIQEAERELYDFVGEAGEIEITDRAPAGKVSLGHPLLEEWCRDEGLKLAPKQAWTDLARFTEAGIPAVNFGPGETAQAHQAGEWCSIVSLGNTYDALYRFFVAAR